MAPKKNAPNDNVGSAGRYLTDFLSIIINFFLMILKLFSEEMSCPESS